MLAGAVPAAAITPEVPEYDQVAEVPSALVAVTPTLTRFPTSAEPSVYCCEVAPEMFAQPLPSALQRCHW